MPKRPPAKPSKPKLGEGVREYDLSGAALAQALEKFASQPRIYATSFQLVPTGNDYTLLLARPEPVPVPGMAKNEIAMATTPLGVIQFSVKSLKDLATLLGRAVADYEQENGPIETEYTRRLGNAH